MTLTQDDINKLKLFEGYRDKAYLDSVGVKTIGFGHTLNVNIGMTCTPEIAEEWLRLDLIPCEMAVERLIHVKLTQGQFTACVDFCYNLGIHQFTQSTLCRLIQEGKMAEASNQFPLWIHAGKFILAGLIARRSWEQKRFLELI